MELIKGGLFLASMWGWLFIVYRKGKIPILFVPVVTAVGISLFLYAGALTGMLNPSSWLVVGAGLLGFSFFIKNVAEKNVSFPAPTLFSVCFGSGILIFTVLTLGFRFEHYDNFSHWAMIVKSMLITDQLPDAGNQLVTFKNYPPGCAVFIYYVCKFLGNAQGVMLLAQNSILFSCFLAVFGIIKEKQRFLLYSFLGMGCSLLSYLNFTIRINNLLVDFLLPLLAMAAIAFVYQSRDSLWKTSLCTTLILGFTCIVKNTGIVFAGFVLAYYIWNIGKKKGIAAWIKAVTVCMTVCLALIPYVVWILYVRCRFSGIEQKFQLAFGKQESLAVSKEQYGQITEEFVKAAFSTSNRAILAFFLCNIAAVLAVLFVRIFLKKQWELGRVLVVVDLMAILYHIGILGLYLFSMPEEEAVRLAGFDRYACSIMVLAAGLLFMQATIDMEHSFAVRIEGNGTYRAFSSPAAKLRYQYMVLATMMIGVNFLYSEINGLLYIQSNYSQSLAGRMETLAGDRWQEEEDQRKYLVAASDREGQVSNGEVFYVSRYFLNAPNVEVTERLDAGNMDEIKKEYDVLIILDESAVHTGTADVENAVWNRSGVYPLKDN
ncbi:hypothetical protein H6A32_04925 [Drancourtella massiliensis]|uniref:Glycosyltransferase RgtA/B/C/D-like domain-containing protein n=1 Tax=Drancourtella massiliensis TaxID=1632013 RepID=A0ABS2EFK4_9FIRM|nr:hypothetical protein [Drancourtella massiliensis]MBM6743652.1 hypothetical protein [Drancourtella massiliensis]